MPISYAKRIELPQLDCYPLFLDYDFAQLRPRGGSACVDMFSFGRLCAIMDELSGSDLVYVQKGNILPCNGFFLMDFAKVAENPKLLGNTIKNMNIKTLWLENSPRYKLDKFPEIFEGVDVLMVSFCE